MNLIHHIQASLQKFCKNDPYSSSDVIVTEVLPYGDKRQHTPEFQEAIEKEIRGLQTNEVYKVIPKRDVPQNANVIGGRFRPCHQEQRLWQRGLQSAICCPRASGQGEKSPYQQQYHIATSFRESHRSNYCYFLVSSFGLKTFLKHICGPVNQFLDQFTSGHQ